MFSTLTVCKMCATEMKPHGPPFPCRICRRNFPRLRNLKRHQCQRAAVPLMSLKLDAPNLGRHPTSPARVSGARLHPPSPQQPPHPPPSSPSSTLSSSPGIQLSPGTPSRPAPKRGRTGKDKSVNFKTRDVGVQVDNHNDRRLRARRRLEDDQTYYGALRLIPGPHPADFEAPKDYTTRVDLRQRRRLCDCVKCVQHGLRLAADRYSAEIPVARGIRYVTLPGIQARPSTRPNRDRLARLLQDHAETTLVVCSCASCTAHRNLLWAWTQARRHTSSDIVPSPPPPPPPVVGGCREFRDQVTPASTTDCC